MANLTLSIDDELLKRARVKAAQEGTSVNEMVRRFLDEAVGGDIHERQQRGVDILRELSENTNVGSGPGGRGWTREELYEERLGRFGNDD